MKKYVLNSTPKTLVMNSIIFFSVVSLPNLDKIFFQEFYYRNANATKLNSLLCCKKKKRLLINLDNFAKVIMKEF